MGRRIGSDVTESLQIRSNTMFRYSMRPITIPSLRFAGPPPVPTTSRPHATPDNDVTDNDVTDNDVTDNGVVAQAVGAGFPELSA
eukprot:5727689-Pyramimonas_sp.AAC.1